MNSLSERSAENRSERRSIDVGVIPVDWQVRSLGDLADPRRPISYGIVQTGPNVAGGVKCLRVVDIEDGRINSANLIATTKAISDSYGRTLLQAGDLVMPLRGKVGEVAHVDGYVAGSNLTRGLALIALAEDAPGFCKQYISWSPTRGRLQNSMNGSALQEISIATLRAFKIAVPSSKKEQHSIAEALSETDALIESLEQLLVKKRHLKQGAMQELLTGKKRLPGFSGDWKVDAVERTGEVLAGKALAVNAPGKLRPYLRTKNVGDGYIDVNDVLAMPFTDEEFTRFRILTGDLLLNEGQSLNLVGRCAMYRGEVEAPCAMQNQLLRFRPNPNTDPKFAEHLFRHCQHSGVFAAIATQTTSVAHLGSVRFSELKLRWPRDRNEQTAIAAVLSDMDAEITAVESKIAKVRLMKQGMMQELLTGRIRLV
jgi:type I restriction enzyme S subunit